MADNEPDFKPKRLKDTKKKIHQKDKKDRIRRSKHILQTKELFCKTFDDEYNKQQISQSNRTLKRFENFLASHGIKSSIMRENEPNFYNNDLIRSEKLENKVELIIGLKPGSEIIVDDITSDDNETKTKYNTNGIYLITIERERFSLVFDREKNEELENYKLISYKYWRLIILSFEKKLNRSKDKIEERDFILQSLSQEEVENFRVNQEKQLKKEERKRLFNRSRSSFQNSGQTETNNKTNNNINEVLVDQTEADDESVTDDSEEDSSDENPEQEQEQDTTIIKQNQEEVTLTDSV